MAEMARNGIENMRRLSEAASSARWLVTSGRRVKALRVAGAARKYIEKEPKVAVAKWPRALWPWAARRNRREAKRAFIGVYCVKCLYSWR